jgi:acyl carrier protein phosphodiesterase
MLPHMIEDDWLYSYRELAHVERALRGISRRLRRENPLAASIEAVRENNAGLESDFGQFFPELWEFARRINAQQARA